MTALLFAMAAAWLSHFAGLSYALGAFLAGMILGETEYRYQIEVQMRSFRDVLLGLFFVVIGMVLNIHVLLETVGWLLPLVVALVLFKTEVIMGLCLLFGFPSAVGMRTGLLLAQRGEFELALVTVAVADGLLETDAVQIVLAVVIISMAMTPILIGRNETICSLLGIGDTNEEPDSSKYESSPKTRFRAHISVL